MIRFRHIVAKAALAYSATTIIMVLTPQARANDSIFDLDPACPAIITATRDLPKTTDYAEWPVKIHNVDIQSPVWRYIPYQDHLEVLRAWATEASLTRKEEPNSIYQKLISELSSGEARFARTEVQLDLSPNKPSIIYGIEMFSIGRGPIDNRPLAQYNHRYKLWNILVENDNRLNPVYFPVFPGSDGLALILVDNRGIVIVPAMASVFSLTTFLKDEVGKAEICPSIRNKIGAVK